MSLATVVLSHHYFPLFFVAAPLRLKDLAGHQHNYAYLSLEVGSGCSEVLGVVLMSSGVEERAIEEVRASCGKAEVDDVKLKKCACNLVKYCNLDCQKNHRPHHKKALQKEIG